MRFAAGRLVGFALVSLLPAALFLSGCESVPACGDRCSEPGRPFPGETSFVSADGSLGDTLPGGRSGGDMEAPPDGEDGEVPSVEEGDIFRPFARDLLLNLNLYRGLQIVDLGDPMKPRILGRLAISGSPVELYVVGQRAVVLLNDRQGYYGSRHAPRATRVSGGVVAIVDLSNPMQPRLVDERPVPGWIARSRLVRGGGGDALYVVAQAHWSQEAGAGAADVPVVPSEERTVVKSFTLEADGIRDASELDLGGWVVDVHATPTALLVARHDWTTGDGGSSVSLIDISRAGGVMVEGGEVRVEGQIQSQFNMDLHGEVLRVVSGRTWGSASNANHIQTFDVSDFASPRAIDSKTFGRNEDLFAILFLGDKAFFVTYERRDPFHAFEIDDEGVATERSQFIVSGWNDFFREALANTRLIGIGVDDEDGRTMAVSLYDITDLENPEPLIARAAVSVESSWSEASWDHRAFSVLEDAVEVEAAGGERETGLVLLPFSGVDSRNTFVSGVQIYTFSPTTLTRRGVMDHGSAVRRSFSPRAGVAANLSEEELGLYSLADPDSPAHLGELALAPAYEELVPFGGYAARLRRSSNPWYRGGSARPSLVEIIPRHASPGAAEAIASIEVPQAATIRVVGDLLVAISMAPKAGGYWPEHLETTIEVFDLGDPGHPQARGRLQTTELLPAGLHGGYGYGGGERPPMGAMADCFGCGWGGYLLVPEIHQAGERLVLVGRELQTRSMGMARTCYSYPALDRCGSDASCSDEAQCPRAPSCSEDTFRGGLRCTTLAGSTSCFGEILRCAAEGSERSCAPVDPATVPMEEHCSSWEMIRHWTSFSLRDLDLSDPDRPLLGDPVELPAHEESGDILVVGDELFLSHRIPHAAANDSRPYVRHFIRRFQPGSKAPGPAINVPGDLLAVDGPTLFTRDSYWVAQRIETAVARLQLEGNLARLVAHRPFPDQEVTATRLDGAGHLLVSHHGHWTAAAANHALQLTILDAASPALAKLSTVEIEDWAELRDARQGRALFAVPGGLLVLNLDAPGTPYPQAYFPLRTWPGDLLIDGSRILLPAGPYGIHELDLDETNLLPPRD